MEAALSRRPPLSFPHFAYSLFHRNTILKGRSLYIIQSNVTKCRMTWEQNFLEIKNKVAAFTTFLRKFIKLPVFLLR